MNFIKKHGLAIVLILACVLSFQFLTTTIADPDGFYHIQHANQYKAGSIFDVSFPWIPTSSISKHGGDLYYGFHLALIPLTAFDDLTVGIKVGSVILALLLLFGVYWIAVKQEFKWPVVWPLLAFLAIPNVLFFFMMLRPHVLSLLFSLLLLYFLSRDSWKGVFWTSLGLTIFHPNHFWLGIGVMIVFFGVQLVFKHFKKGFFAKEIRTTLIKNGLTSEITFERDVDVEDDPYRDTESPNIKSQQNVVSRSGQASTEHSHSAVFYESGSYINWMHAVWGIAGTLLGIFLRPNPIGTIKLIYVQTFKLLFEKTGDLPILLSREVDPLPLTDILTTSTFFLITWLLGLGVLVYVFTKKRNEWDNLSLADKSFLAASTILSVGFFYITVQIAHRGFMLWLGFGVMMLGMIVSKFVPVEKYKKATIGILIVLLIGTTYYAVMRHQLNVYYVGHPYDEFKEVGEWLTENTEPGDLVFNNHWDNFGALFFYAPNNHYVGGIDAIFQYDFNTDLYWKGHYLAIDLASGNTCGIYPCDNESLVDTYKVMVEDFNAQYFFVEPWRNPNVATYLEVNPGYELVFETDREKLYRILRP